MRARVNKSTPFNKSTSLAIALAASFLTASFSSFSAAFFLATSSDDTAPWFACDECAQWCVREARVTVCMCMCACKQTHKDYIDMHMHIHMRDVRTVYMLSIFARKPEVSFAQIV